MVTHILTEPLESTVHLEASAMAGDGARSTLIIDAIKVASITIDRVAIRPREAVRMSDHLSVVNEFGRREPSTGHDPL
jgi:hypothetical protein